MVFDGRNYSKEYRIFWLNSKVLEIETAFRNKIVKKPSYVERMIKWELPQAEFFVLNTDACVKGQEKRA